LQGERKSIEEHLSCQNRKEGHQVDTHKKIPRISIFVITYVFTAEDMHPYHTTVNKYLDFQHILQAFDQRYFFQTGRLCPQN